MSFLILEASEKTYVFLEDDPRQAGFAGCVQEDVSLDDDYPEILHWPKNEPPQHWLGVSRDNESEYRVFPSPEDCRSAGYDLLGTRFWTGKSLDDWQRAK